MLKAKIHRATVTDANLQYEGSITIDRNLMDEVRILPNEKVHIYNINNGSRADTYVIEGKAGSGEICCNGALARLVQVGDLIIIVSYCIVDEKEAGKITPKIINLDDSNKIKK